jgi:hypothetical protein
MIKIEAQRQIEMIRIEAEDRRHQATLEAQREAGMYDRAHAAMSGDAERELKREMAESAKAGADD